MRRVSFLQQWYGLADEALEAALYDRQARRSFARIDLKAEGVPAAPTLLQFRRRLETHDLGKGLFHRPHRRHQTPKGNQWYFGMQAPIGADRDSKLGPPVGVTAANVAAITKTAELLHGEEPQVPADAGSTGVEKRAEIVALERKIDWQIAGRRSLSKARAEGAAKEARKAVEQAKAAGRACVEHPFPLGKNLFRHRQGRYRGLAQNGHQRYPLFGLANVVIGARARVTA